MINPPKIIINNIIPSPAINVFLLSNFITIVSDVFFLVYQKYQTKLLVVILESKEIDDKLGKFFPAAFSTTKTTSCFLIPFLK